jgi:hypothetical protein
MTAYPAEGCMPMRSVLPNRLPTQHSNTPPQPTETTRPRASKKELTLILTQVEERLARWVAAVLATLDGASDNDFRPWPDRRFLVSGGSCPQPRGLDLLAQSTRPGAGTFPTNERPSHAR